MASESGSPEPPEQTPPPSPPAPGRAARMRGLLARAPALPRVPRLFVWRSEMEYFGETETERVFLAVARGIVNAITATASAAVDAFEAAFKALGSTMAADWEHTVKQMGAHNDVKNKRFRL